MGGPGSWLHIKYLLWSSLGAPRNWNPIFVRSVRVSKTNNYIFVMFRDIHVTKARLIHVTSQKWVFTLYWGKLEVSNCLHTGALRGGIFFPLCIPNNACVVRIFPFSLLFPSLTLSPLNLAFILNDRVSAFDGHGIQSAHFVLSRL